MNPFAKHKFHGDTAAALLLCGVFLFFSMGFVLLGGTIYENQTQAAEENAGIRTAQAYVLNQVRRGEGKIGITQFGDGDALVLYQTYDSETYVTCLYTYEGQLKELFTSLDTEAEPDWGTDILPLTSLEITENGMLLQIRLIDGEKELGNIWYHAVAGTEEVTLP